MKIRLLVIVADDAKRDWLVKAFLQDVELEAVGAGVNLEAVVQAHPDYAPTADVILIDLDHSDIPLPQFWITIHLLYPGAQIVALVSSTINDIALRAALQGWVCCFAEWAASIEVLCDAVRAAFNQSYSHFPLPVLDALPRLFGPSRSISTTQVNSSDTDINNWEKMLARWRQSLSKLEFGVLACLVRNQGQVISPAELVREVWKSDPETGDIANQVNCCIKRLRHKLNSDPQNRFQVLTVRGHGYRLLMGQAPKTADDSETEEN